jgi:Sulfotransferase family
MIVSHKHKFIFIKTEKTASSSIEIALSRVCGPDDIITPARADLEAQRATPGQNYRIEHPLKPQRPLWRRILRRPERLYHPSVGYYEHMPAWRIRTYVGDDVWNSYFKFAFTRNPWDAQVSYYFYKTRHDSPRPSFEAFMKRGERARVQLWNLYTLDGAVAVDKLGRYENLDADFAEIQRRIGLKETLVLPVTNASDKPKDRYRDFYTGPARAIADAWYADEAKAHGYEF